MATPADAAMMMQLGMDGVFVGSGEYRRDDGGSDDDIDDDDDDGSDDDGDIVDNIDGDGDVRHLQVRRSREES